MIPTTSAASTPSRRVTIRASSMRSLLRRALIAQAADLQGMAGRKEAVGAADLALQCHDARADELDHPAAPGAHQVVVLLAAVHVLVEEAVALQPLLARQ